MEDTKDRLIKENDELITDILKRNYYNEFLQDNSEKNIELIINRKNTQSTCYGCFNNTETKMYPYIDFSENDYDKIYNNLSAFLKYYDAQNWHCPVELNGIDWSNDEINEKILVLLQTFANKTIYNFPKKIIVDTDFYAFAENQNDAEKRWRRRYEGFKKTGINLFFNIYTDGYYCNTDEKYSDVYWDKLIFWLNSLHLNKHSWKIIAYIRPSNVKNWIKNYDWWIDQIGDLAFSHIELREEKTEDWTYEAIGDYLNFLNHQIEVLQNRFSAEQFEQIVFDKAQKIIFQNIALLENKYLINERKNNNCNFFKNLTIDLTTMNIVPCAKINYEDFACGQYIVDNNMIVSVKAKNIPIVILNTHLKQSCMPHCENCEHIEHCAGHCLGESYNKCYDMLTPIREFCDLSKAKINFLIYRYLQLNLLTENNFTKWGCNPLYKKSLLTLIEQIQQGGIL